MNIWWDACNKWLYFGTRQRQNNQFILMLSDWYWVGRQPIIREWSLFKITWDNGAFWGVLPEVDDISIPHMDNGKIARSEFSHREGDLDCIVQIVIMGIGFRYCYKKHMSVVWKKQPKMK